MSFFARYLESPSSMLARLNSLGAVGVKFTDSNFAIKGSSDATKLARFEVDGFTTATTRTFTLPNASVTLAGLSLAQTFSATQTFAGIDATSIGATTRGTGLFTTLGANGQITSTLATGTAPFVVASTTNVANLNASSLSGATFAAPGAIGSGTPSTGAFTTISATGVITSTLATGTAPFTVASTTVVGNLNVSQLLGNTWAAPGAIGGTTPGSAAHTTGTYSSTLTVSGLLTCDTSSSGLTLSKTTGTTLNVSSTAAVCASFGGGATIGASLNGENRLTVGNQGGSGAYAITVLLQGSTHYAWLFGAQYTQTETFEIIPSTATGGTTFSGPVFSVGQNSSVVCGSLAALATNATDGFLYMPTCAGTPTGVPTSKTGKVAYVYDTTNDKICIYNGGWKKTVALT